MDKEKRKLTAKKIRNIYLYPYRSKGENLARGLVWMASWFIGIVCQQTPNQQALGGAYLIFAVSLLLEFFSEGKEYLIPKIAHSAFLTLLFAMSMGSVALSFWQISDEQAKKSLFYQLFVTTLPYIGWTVFFIISIATVLALVEAHKYFFDEEIERKRKLEAEQDAKRKQFQESLAGPQNGGNT